MNGGRGDLRIGTRIRVLRIGTRIRVERFERIPSEGILSLNHQCCFLLRDKGSVKEYTYI